MEARRNCDCRAVDSSSGDATWGSEEGVGAGNRFVSFSKSVKGRDKFNSWLEVQKKHHPIEDVRWVNKAAQMEHIRFTREAKRRLVHYQTLERVLAGAKPYHRHLENAFFECVRKSLTIESSGENEKENLELAVKSRNGNEKCCQIVRKQKILWQDESRLAGSWGDREWRWMEGSEKKEKFSLLRREARHRASCPPCCRNSYSRASSLIRSRATRPRAWRPCEGGRRRPVEGSGRRNVATTASPPSCSLRCPSGTCRRSSAVCKCFTLH